METGVLSAIIGLVGLAFAVILFTFIRSKPAGTDVMKEISEVIHKGAMVFLKREYSILALFIIIVFALRVILIGYLINLFSVPSYYYFMGKGQVKFCFLNHFVQAALNFIIITILIILESVDFHLVVTSYAFSLAFSAIILILLYNYKTRKYNRIVSE